ncbi:hypothetical protein LTS18_003220 [Coniosporium uncinatum]|uniref:Uncharacterized protein n=1 Tax=Coniosporium uncinatum TaxID=93489 RepID=A0ACC3D715_9PEZI|nr:hypothetical protein LTS18_003220 [Coniosporium uncinatum]
MDKRAQIPPGLPRSNPTVSYWQDPPDDIADLRSTEELPNTADFVIVGSGISGACIAHNILERKQNVRVVMLEARSACSGATGRNGGHTKAASYRTFPYHVNAQGVEEAVKVARLEYANIRATHEMAAKHDIRCESRSCPTVDIIYDQGAYESGISVINTMQKHMDPKEGAAQYQIYGAEETRKKFLTPGADVSGAFEYEAGSLSAYKFAIGMVKLCLDKGLNLQTNTPVTIVSAAPTANGSLNGNTELKARWTVKTARGCIATPNLILATNGYTPHLLPELQSKIVPLRGQVIAQRPGPKLASLTPKGLATTYSFTYDAGYEYMISRAEHPDVPSDLMGDIVIGGGLGRLPNDGVSEFGETDDTVLNTENSNYLGQTLRTYFGGNWGEDDPQSSIRKEWTGIMGITSDGLPMVGPVPGKDGVWVSAGFNGHGELWHYVCGFGAKDANI